MYCMCDDFKKLITLVWKFKMEYGYMTYPNTANSSLCCFSPDFFLQHKTSKMTVWGHSTLKSRIKSALKDRINKYEGMFFWKTEIKILKNNRWFYYGWSIVIAIFLIFKALLYVGFYGNNIIGFKMLVCARHV